jgi:hypothetical protein
MSDGLRRREIVKRDDKPALLGIEPFWSAALAAARPDGGEPCLSAPTRQRRSNSSAANK